MTASVSSNPSPAPFLTPTTSRPSDRLLGLLGVRIALFVLTARKLLPGVLENPFNLASYHDDHFHYAHEDIARITILRFHELPVWSPYYCGGIEGIGNPQDVSLAPDFLLRLVFGTGPGRHLAVVLFTVLGMEGAYRLARRYDASVIASAMAGIAFAASGRFAPLLHDGWIHFFAYQLVPWTVVCLEGGITSRAHRLWGGFFLAWMVLCGGTYVVPHTGVLLVLLVIFDTLRIALARARRADAPPWYAPARSLLVMGLVGLGLAAVRVLPMLAVIGGHPRTVPGVETMDPAVALYTLVLPHLVAGEYPAAGGAYVGTAVAALAVYGVLWLDRAATRALVVAGIFAFLAMGAIVPWAPWRLLHAAPLFSQLRNPDRIIFIACLFIAIAGARGLTLAEDVLVVQVRRLLARPPFRRVLSRWPAFALGTVGAIVALFIGYRAAIQVVNDDIVPAGSLYGMDPVRRYDDAFRQARGNRWDQQVWAPANRGSLACFEETEFFQSPKLRGDLAAEEFAAPGSDADVTRIAWSPHRIELHVVARSASTILVNQNWSKAWRTNIGTIASEDGLLAIRVPAGDHDLVVRYRDPRAITGAFISVATVIALLAIAFLSLRVRARVWLTRVRALPWQSPEGSTHSPEAPIADQNTNAT